MAQHTSIALNTPCEIIDITPLNPQISKCQIKVCYVSDEPNRNMSVISKETAKKIANSLPGSPIVGYYNEETQDFDQHTKEIYIEDGQLKFKSLTQPYGFVDLNARCWFQKYLDDGADEREYLVTEGYLWTGQYPECQRVIDKGNNQSMELNQKIIDAYWAKDENGLPQFFIINNALISKLCILGEDQEPCFEGASVTEPKVEFALDDEFKEQMTEFMRQIQETLNKGGNDIMDEMKEEIVENSAVVEEPEVVADNTQVVLDALVGSETVSAVGETTATYSLDDIPEYVELKESFESLQTSYSQLTEQMSGLTETLGKLQEFKKEAEKKEKLEKIKEFYMLSDEDKKDVMDNIDTYSLEDIENKLAVICFRNKVSFSDEEKKSDEDVTTYSLNETLNNDTTPAWVRAISSTQQAM